MATKQPLTTPADGESDTPKAPSQYQIDKAVPLRPTRTQKPDLLVIDNHQFTINYGVPQDVTDRLLGLFTRREDPQNVTYDDVPEDLKAYEVVSLSGHRFRCNSDVPADVRERLQELWLRSRSPGFKYEDVPEDLMVYHMSDIKVLRGDPE